MITLWFAPRTRAVRVRWGLGAYLERLERRPAFQRALDA